VKLFWNIVGSIRSSQEKKAKKDVNLNEEFLALKTVVRSVTFNIVSDDVWFQLMGGNGENSRMKKGYGFELYYDTLQKHFYAFVDVTIPGHFNNGKQVGVCINYDKFLEMVVDGKIVVTGYAA
jgi:hypothetical protein